MISDRTRAFLPLSHSLAQTGSLARLSTIHVSSLRVLDFRSENSMNFWFITTFSCTINSFAYVESFFVDFYVPTSTIVWFPSGSILFIRLWLWIFLEWVSPYSCLKIHKVFPDKYSSVILEHKTIFRNFFIVKLLDVSALWNHIHCDYPGSNLRQLMRILPFLKKNGLLTVSIIQINCRR